MKLITGSLSNYNLNIKAADRKWVATVYYDFNNTSYSINSNNIKSFDISDYVTDGKNITMGCVSTSKITLNLVKATATVASRLTNGTTFSIRLRLNNSWMLKSETFVIDKNTRVRRNDGSYDCSITAFDKSFLMTRPFTADGTGIAAVDAVTSIASKYGLTVDPSVNEAVTALGVASQLPVMQDYTDKQVLGFIAGCYGCNARINEDDAICFEWFTSSDDEIGPDRIYSDGCFVSEMEQRTIALIESGTNDDPLVAPNNAAGYSINFENPMMSVEHINAVYNQKIANNAISYRIGKVRYKGNPLNRPGTILTIWDIDGEIALFYIMKRSIHYDGGLSETIECLGEGDTALSYKPISPLQQKVERAMSRMEEAIANATDIITQTRGSIYELIPVDENDSSQGISGWRLFSTDPTRRNAIVANSSGIGFSSNGGQSFNAAAIYIDENGQGHINGDFIDVGMISAEHIDTSSITIGASQVEGLNVQQLESAIRNAQQRINTFATAQTNITDICLTEDKTFINGANIATGSILADSIAANAITTDKLNVGFGKKHNLFYNDEFYNGTNGWFVRNGALNAHNQGADNAYVTIGTNSGNGSGIYQPVWLENGKGYSLVFQIFFVNGLGNTSDATIGFLIDTNSYEGEGFEISSQSINSETVCKINIVYNGETGYHDVGLFYTGFRVGGSVNSDVNIAWMALTHTTEAEGFYCSNESWLAEGYEESNLLQGKVGFSTTADSYLYETALSVDGNGNLATIGRIESFDGFIGNIKYDKESATARSSCYYTLKGDTSGEVYVIKSSMSIENAPFFIENYNAENDLIDNTILRSTKLVAKSDAYTSTFAPGGILISDSNNYKTVVLPSRIETDDVVIKVDNDQYSLSAFVKAVLQHLS